MQFTTNINLAMFAAIPPDNQAQIDAIFEKLDDSTKAQAAKGKMLQEQQNPPAAIIANMKALSTQLEPLFAAFKLKFGKALRITSGYRAPLLNKAVGGKTNSAHTTGQAVDLGFTTQAEATFIIDQLLLLGFKRIGLGSSFIHADTSTTLPHPACWLYSAKYKTPTWLAAMEAGIEKRMTNRL